MTQNQLHTLMCAGADFAQAATHIFSSIESCNKYLEEKKAVGNARLFDLSLAFHAARRAKEYFENFLLLTNLDCEKLNDIPINNKETI